MTRYVIGPDIAIHLAGEEAVIPDGHHMLAPAILRSQMLYSSIGSTRDKSPRRMPSTPVLPARDAVRLLEKPLLQNAAWNVADQLGWPDTFDAEYVALTQLQADALIMLHRQPADAVKDLVTVAPIEALF